MHAVINHLHLRIPVDQLIPIVEHIAPQLASEQQRSVGEIVAHFQR